MKINKTFFYLITIFTLATAQEKPTKVIGAGLGATAQTEYHLTAGNSVKLYSDTVYILTGFYFVDSTSTLNIQAGTVILGDSASQGTLIIKRGGKIYAEGSKTNPIVFTSQKNPGQRKRGDWGGIIILGNAPTNKPASQAIEGLSGKGGEFGGSIVNDNSGVLKFVRIEYPGIVISPNNEINGLTLGGVGSGTVIENIQVSYSNDDAFEFFGGNVNLKNIVALAATDDDFDSDYGYVGKIQFAFSKKDSLTWDAAGQTNGFESDNEGTAPYLATPFTAPYFCNFTLIGPQPDTSFGLLTSNKHEYGAVIRRNSKMNILNSVIAGFNFGLSVRDSLTALSFMNGDFVIQGLCLQSRTNLFHNDSKALSALSSQSKNFKDLFNTPNWNNSGIEPRSLNAIGGTWNPFASPVPNPVPSSNSEASQNAVSLPISVATSFVQTNYRGAFDPSKSRDEQWDAGWTNYNPQNTNYKSALSGVSTNKIIAKEFTLSQNYPNPFNPTTKINFSLSENSNIKLELFDIMGRNIKTIINGNYFVGSHSIQIDGKDLKSGLYFYTLKAGNKSITKQMLLIK